MLRKKVSVMLLITMLGCSVLGGAPTETQAANHNLTYSIQILMKKLREKAESYQPKRGSASQHVTTQRPSTEVVTTEEVLSTEELTTERYTTEEMITTEKVISTTEVISTQEVISTTEAIVTTSKVTTEESVSNPSNDTVIENTGLNSDDTTVENTTDTDLNLSDNTTVEDTDLDSSDNTTEDTILDSSDDTTVEDTDLNPSDDVTVESTENTDSSEDTTVESTEDDTTVSNSEEKDKINEMISHYEVLANAEADWLWSQQLSNGAFAFYNHENGSVYINPYFSEIVAISLIQHDSSNEAKAKIENYFDWHFSHINTAETDYNGLAGTIYDYDVEVKNGIVVSETSRNVYDSTDSYSALFIKALAEYAKAYGDESYLLEHEVSIKEITNVMFATMSGGYTYAKPDYNIIYLMDNAEVYAGLEAAKYIYSNVINDPEMYEKVSNALAFYDENFNKHWWKGDHYATVLNPDYSEYTGYAFSWNEFYPCATAQMFPILYGIIDADSTYAQTVYEGLCNAWVWEQMDFVDKNASVFCWGNFAYLGGLMRDQVRFDSYMDKYQEIVDDGRKYPLYSSEAAMVLLGCDEMIAYLEAQLEF